MISYSEGPSKPGVARSSRAGRATQNPPESPTFGDFLAPAPSQPLARKSAYNRHWLALASAAFTLLLMASSASAEPLKVSASLLIAAQTADLVSTHHALQTGRGYEANPLMQGESQRIALKAATTAGVMLLMTKLDRTHPKLARVCLYTMAGSVAVIAARNLQIARMK